MTNVTTADRLDPQVIAGALREQGRVKAADRIVDLTAEPIGIGATADTFRLALQWSGPTPGPTFVVAKVPSADPTAAGTAAALGAYEREVRFYEELAPRLDVDLPAFHGAFEVAGRRSGLLLEDLTVAARPLDQLAEGDLDLVARARRHLVRVQAPFWQDQAMGAQSWLHRRLGVPILEIATRMERSWASSRDRIAADFDPAEREVIDRFVPAAAAWAESWEGPYSVTHHDYRFDNMLVAGDRLLILDWQTVGWGVPTFDLAYLLGTSLEPATRRRLEREEIHRHVDELAEHGVGWGRDDAWEAYRRASFAILLMLVPPTGSVKRSDRLDTMFRRLLSFGARMVLDLDGLEFLDEGRRA